MRCIVLLGLATAMLVSVPRRADAQPTTSEARSAEVAFESFYYSGVDPLARDAGGERFLNPILSGFYPDPSICRVGGDYYLINSTFAYFPGIPIFHSRDLVNWRQIGNALTRPSQTEALAEADTSGGVYAATIEHHGGKFYIASTLVGREGGNFVITADRPGGPWSDPIWFRNVHGIDPALFFDDDGRTYLLHNGPPPDEKPLYDGHRAIWIWQVDLEEGKTVSGPRLLINGGTDLARKPVWIEGPHILKKDGWYILSAAEGGTGPAHSQVVFRSRNVTGPYEPFAGNPILTQRHLPPDRPNPVTCTGHADLLELPNGQWWAVFLACRPVAPDHYVLTGRETFLLPVRWQDGWPTILDKDAAVPLLVKRPQIGRAAGAEGPADLPTSRPAVSTTGTFTFHEEFDSPDLDPAWMTYRRPRTNWSRVEHGSLKIRPLRVALTSRTDNAAFLCRRQQHAKYEVHTAVNVRHHSGSCDAGLAVFQDERHHFFFGIRAKESVASELFVERAFLQDRTNEAEARPEVLKAVPLPARTSRVELMLSGNGLELDFAFRCEGDDAWTMVHRGADASILTEKVAGGFTGVCVGMHARAIP